MKDKECLSICILNIRSFKKHCLDLSNDKTLSKCDIIALTETQLFSNVANDEMSSILKDFFLYRQDHNSDKFLRLAVCYKETITLTETEYFSSINGLKLVISNLDRSFTCLLLYRKNVANIQQFISCLEVLFKTRA